MDVYIVKDDRTTLAMQPYPCKDETRELQDILEKNPCLLPGDQIDSEAPCQWMLVKREMPVPDPSTGLDRWYLDFLFVDQKATPTFVECKLFKNAQARREVVGQVLEYAANGQYYWSAADIRRSAEGTAAKHGSTIDDAFQRLQAEADSLDTFFAAVEKKLKAGEVRIIFFLEKAPNELKSLVEFLSKQMTSSEVLLVEARQFQTDGLRVVVPTVFGFAEQAREIRRLVSNARDGVPAATDWDSFKANAQKKGLDDQTIGGIRCLYDTCEGLLAEISWGRGTMTASFSPKWPTICSNAAAFSVYSTGVLQAHFSSFKTSDTARDFRERFGNVISNELGLTLPNDWSNKWVEFPPHSWLPKNESLINSLKGLIPHFTKRATDARS